MSRNGCQYKGREGKEAGRSEGRDVNRGLWPYLAPLRWVRGKGKKVKREVADDTKGEL